MVTKNLPQYATEKWEDYIVSVTEASKSNSGVPLVVSDMNIYNFDDICKSLFPDRDVHTSADGLRFQRGKVELVEFKSGFSQIITKDKATSKNYFLVIWAEDFGSEKVLKTAEYFVYCGVFKTHLWGERFAQSPKGEFLEVPISLSLLKGYVTY